MKTEDIPDHIKDVKDDIIDQIIACQHNQECNHQCTQAFKIIPQELQFYRRMNLPLPRLCPNCRHYERLKQRNPLKLWKRQCQCGGKASHRPDHEIATPQDKDTPGAPLIEQDEKRSHFKQPRCLKSRNDREGYQNTVSHFHGDFPCPNTFETSYAPERPEIVYCEQCYNQEVA
jgi:hypothetical protein